MSQTIGRTKTLRTSRNAIKIINQAVRGGDEHCPSHLRSHQRPIAAARALYTLSTTSGEGLADFAELLSQMRCSVSSLNEVGWFVALRVGDRRP